MLLGLLHKSKSAVPMRNWYGRAVSIFCISLFPDVKSGVVRAASFKKERDRRSGAALRSRERALPEKKGWEGKSDARRMRIVIIMTRSVGRKFLKKAGAFY